AKAAGLREFGMSDHWVLPPYEGFPPVDWAIPLDGLDDYIAEMQSLQQELNDGSFTLRIGLEVDFFEENWRENLANLSSYPLDYLIGAVHYAGEFPIDHLADDWNGLSQQEIDRIWDVYWRKMQGMIETRRFQIAAHLDLPKKFNFFPSGDWHQRACELLPHIRETGMLLELNTAGWEKACAEQYPAQAILTEALRQNIPILISADAHDPRHVNRYFPRAQKLLNASAKST
ncbi:MAG: histidinol-phosphatase, partial [Victivallales bacterium]|nr:histidinol-phosphatase [Victivallales bacterium]